MRRPSFVLVGLVFVAVVSVTAAAGRSAADRAEASAGKVVRLQRFLSCGDLVAYAKRHALARGIAWGTPRPVVSVFGGEPAARAELAPSAAEADYSTTNVQEAGVDEADIVKTNGSHIFVVAQGKLQAVAARGRPRLVGSLPLEQRGSHELLLHEDRLLVLSQGYRQIEPDPRPVPDLAVASSIVPIGSLETVLTEVDVSDPAEMRIVRTVTFEGSYLTSRLVGSTARVVVSTAVPRELPTSPPEADPAAAAKSVIESSTLANWLPSYLVEDARSGAKTTRPLVQCRHVRRPATFSGFGMLTVLTLDLEKGIEPVDSDAVVTNGQIVYASTKSLYIATQKWTGNARTNAAATALHRFDTSERAKTHYRASGEVSGSLLSQWSLSEHKGALRVVTTEADPSGGGDSESFVSVVDERGGKLVQIGRVGNIGRGEQVYAVRFIGDVGYVVTFRQVDPLYTLDLSNPEEPKIVGELKIPGYSAYLHPLDDNLLLGVGQDATDDGRVLGTQISLFDVSNLRRPERLHQRTIGRGQSEAEFDHHAFLYWKATRLAVVPFQMWQPQPFLGAIGFRVGRDNGIDEVGRISHANGVNLAAKRWDSATDPIRRSLVVGGTVYTVSERGVRASDLRTLANEGWVTFG